MHNPPADFPIGRGHQAVDAPGGGFSCRMEQVNDARSNCLVGFARPWDFAHFSFSLNLNCALSHRPMPMLWSRAGEMFWTSSRADDLLTSVPSCCASRFT